ncbi:ABC transporter substrate-binding protein [Salidesulfovibrio brasiliensis]|uniref:ABC transporter substrate-binding protein n=1 Tax=Salidesulfovibrio brasiliensis TaxID=221711 RepID=UPI0006D20075|nr:ABC transporter substrate-binding protein [Salidesulfovibrio brasiliensis]
MKKRHITALAVVMAVLMAVPALAEIRIGVLSDLSGPTSSVGTPYAKGIKDCITYLNDNGGIGGEEIAYDQVDYAYKVPQALSAYKRFKSKGIVAMQGWGTGDTEALVRFVAKDRIPVFSASYSPHLMDPEKAPYNFTVAPDYSTQGRAGLKYAKSNWKGTGTPRIAFLYPDKPYGLVPIPALKEYAEELGFEIVGEENVSLKAMDASPQLLSLKKKAPDFVWVGGTTPSTAVIMKDAKKLGMNTTFIVNIWGNDENLQKMAGDAANGHLGLQAAAIYGQDVPGMKVIEKLTGGEPQMTHYVRGFVSMLVLAEGMRRAADSGEVTGESIKAALENMRDYDPMGLAPAISFFPDDHRPNMAVNVVTYENGEMKSLGIETLPRDRKWLGH